MPTDAMSRQVPGRDRKLGNFRKLDVLLSLLLVLGFIGLSQLLPFWKSFAVLNAVLVPLFFWLSWRQYTILDEYVRVQLLKAYAVAGIVTLGLLFALVAWCAWRQASVIFQVVIGLLYGTLFLGWASSWVTWLWLRRGTRE